MAGAQAGQNEISNNMTSIGAIQQMQAWALMNSAAAAEAGSVNPNDQAALALTKAAKKGLSAACLESTSCVMMAIIAAQNQPKAPSNTGGDQIADQSPTNTGGNQLVDPNISHTGNNQPSESGTTNTGNTDGAPNVGGNTTTTPVAEQNPDDLAYLAEGRDNRLPIPELTVAGNGLKIESNSKHTPGAQGFRPNAGVEPRNSLDLFDSSIATKDPKIRLSIDNDGNIHRFFNTSKDGTGTFHWSGSTGDGNNVLGNKELGSFNKEIKVLRGK